jgi:diguanylate cyclase (GGDEF)-like protein
LEFVALKGFDDAFYDLKIPLKKAFLYELTNGEMRHSVIVPSVVEFNRTHMSEEEFDRFYEKYPMAYQTTITAPIRVDGKFLGVINLDSSSYDGFSDDDIAVMDLFASQLETSIRNHNLMMKNIYLSRYDKLTGAMNRSYFEELILKRIRSNESFSFVVIDMNDLKSINDQYGHIEGDRCLSLFSRAVNESIRDTDVFARIGGDEFILVLDDFKSYETTKVLVRILQHLSVYEELPYNITFSYGVTDFPAEAATYEQLSVTADQKMYKMKERSKEEFQ